jgi:SAM-dependent methyltransferase
MDERLRANRAHWDELVALHQRTPQTYDLEGFRAGRSTLKAIELEEVGDVRGKRLLHLQCHFGLDTLSWARRGAHVVGADFSPRAIATARALSAELGVAAEFVCADLADLPRHLEGAFDVVFTSYGVLCWLPDLVRWGEVIAHFLAPGGFFYIVEQHPLGAVFEGRGDGVAASGSYFERGPFEEKGEGSYADPTARFEHDTRYQWHHPLSDVVGALAGAGLRVEFVHEFPFCMFRWLPSMVRGADGWYRVPGREGLRFLFSLKASRT